MEPIQIISASVKNVAYLLSSPIYCSFGLTVVIFLLMRFYCRLTLGMCDCVEQMTDKTVIITGGNSGIGKETAVDLARRNARVIIGCRSMERGTKAVEDIIAATGNSQVILKHLDLNSFSSVRAFADDIIKTEPRLDVLVNNAGMGGREKAITEDGCDMIMQSNHLGHFLLTNLLLDLIKKSSPSRIINVSSLVYKYDKLNPDDLNCTEVTDLIRIYSNTKMANVLFTRELAEKLSGTGVTVNALHPGLVKTNILQNRKGLFPLMTKFMFFVIGKSPFEGAQTSIHLAVSPTLRETTGKFFSDCKEEKLVDRAKDKDLARRLWRSSAVVVGLSELAKIE